MRCTSFLAVRVRRNTAAPQFIANEYRDLGPENYHISNTVASQNTPRYGRERYAIDRGLSSRFRVYIAQSVRATIELRFATRPTNTMTPDQKPAAPSHAPAQWGTSLGYGDPITPDELAKIPIFEGVSKSLMQKNFGAIVRRRFKAGD